MFAAKARDAAGESRRPAECRRSRSLPERTRRRPHLIGQNWDWLPHAFDTCVVLEVDAGRRTRLRDGRRSRPARQDRDELERDRPGDQRPRERRRRRRARCALPPGAARDPRCETISDALAVLQRGLRSSSANYLIAHRDGLAVDVEAAPGGFARLFLLFPVDGVLLHTNHFLSRRSSAVSTSGCGSCRTVRSGSSAFDGRLPTRPRRSRSSPFREPSPITRTTRRASCCHPDPRSAPIDQGATVASVLMDLDTATMWVADGHPCTVAYRRLDYADFLAKAPAVARED